MNLDHLLKSQVLVKTIDREMRGFVVKVDPERIFVKWGGDPTNVARILIASIKELYQVKDNSMEEREI